MPMFTSFNKTSGFIKSNKSIIPSQARKIPGFIRLNALMPMKS